MKNQRAIRVTCPACDVLYRLWDETLLPIARCGHCYGTVVPEGADGSAAARTATLPETAAA